MGAAAGGHVIRALQQRGDAEVREMQVAFSVYQKVGRLHVLVDHAAAMGVGEGLRCGETEDGHVISTRRRDASEIGSLHHVHCVEQPFSRRSRHVDLDDVRVVEHRERLGLAQETGAARGTRRDRHRQDLDRDFSRKGNLLGLVDRTHGPMTDLAYKPPVRAAEVGRHVRFASGRCLAKFVQLARKRFKLWAHVWTALYHLLT